MTLPPHPPHEPISGEQVRVGLAGWSYADWQGIVYPRAGKSFNQLDWIARFTDLVEINATFYRPARPRDAERWARTVEGYPNFRFTAKLERIFTHQDGQPGAQAERIFRQGLSPLVEAGLLAAVLIQFPYSFHNTDSNRTQLSDLLTRFADYSLVVELRHRSWLTPEILSFLDARQVTLAGLDQPQIGLSIQPSLPLTGPFFYIRLHGRNDANWFRPDAGRDARYDYLYGPEELAPWVTRIREAALQNMPGIVVANNHYRGQAAANVVEIRAALSGEQVPAPPDLIRTYPQLAAAARALKLPGASSGRLF